MKLIVDLLRRVWQGGRTAPDTRAVQPTAGGDRSSMADLVRILRMHDEDLGRRKYPN